MRLVFLVQSAFWSSFFSWIEKIRFSNALKNAPLPDNPIFIIGHWRTGSTLLHQLMSLDPQLSAPTLFQVAVPDSFLVSATYYRPIFKRLISEHRPMDQVKIGMDEPQEDEYAIYRITNCSPLEDLIFGKSGPYFLNHETQFFPSGSSLDAWKKNLIAFYTKLYYHSKKRIVSKNPFNSYRIKILCELFPKAKFINIVRHPDDVVPSTIHMWDIVQRQNRLNKPVERPGFIEVVEVLKNMMASIEADCEKLPAGHYAEIRFEDLESQPVAALKKIYHQMDIDFTPEFETKINEFIRQTADFRKNEFSLTSQEKSYIRENLVVYMNKYDYI
jgi:hypothetical protein